MTSEPGGPGWRIDPETLLPEILDMAVFQAALSGDPCREVLTACGEAMLLEPWGW